MGSEHEEVPVPTLMPWSPHTPNDAPTTSRSPEKKRINKAKVEIRSTEAARNVAKCDRFRDIALERTKNVVEDSRYKSKCKEKPAFIGYDDVTEKLQFLRMFHIRHKTLVRAKNGKIL